MGLLDDLMNKVSEVTGSDTLSNLTEQGSDIANTVSDHASGVTDQLSEHAQNLTENIPGLGQSEEN